MATQPKTHLTPEQYLEIERKAEFKSEYYQGEMFAMSGASYPHIGIVANAVASLHQQLRRGPCRPLSNDMRVRVTPAGLYTYPDVDGWDVYHVRNLPAARALPSAPHKRHLIAGSRIVSPQFLGSPAAPQQPDHLFPLPLACRILYAGRDECPVVHRPHGCRLPAAFAMRKESLLEWGLMEPSCSVLSGEKPS